MRASTLIALLGDALCLLAGESLSPCTQHRLAMVVVDVDDPGPRDDGLGDLVGVVRGRDAGADVKELADASLVAR